MIELVNICKTFDNAKSFAVKDINLNIKKNETIVFLGTSGSGKTTTMNMINQLVVQTKGDIFIDGENILNLNKIHLRRNIGHVFQKMGLFPHLNIFDNISIIMKLEKLSLIKIKERVNYLLEFVNLDPDKYLNCYPHQLSGGQQQRVAIARALANNPEILLMDEPFSALDSINRSLLQQEFLKMKKNFEKTIIFVTHDIFEAFTIADSIAIFHNGEIIQYAKKQEILKNPANEIVEKLFLGPFLQVKSMITEHSWI